MTECSLPIFDSSHYNILTPSGIVNIMIGVLFFSIFIGIFYFTYAAMIEKTVVKTQVVNAITTLLHDSQFIKYDRAKMKAVLNSMSPPDLSKEDKEVEAKNAKIVKSTIILFSVFAAVVSIIILILYKIYKFDFKPILIVNVILLVFVAITEVFFLNVIASKYMSLDPNVVKKEVISKLLELQQ